MANVIQTKKKRDKKKKKEDGNEEFVFLQPTPIPTPVDDLNIHVDKEATTGGGLCAKLVFFVLLTVLSTLIGLILTEHRGLTDLDTINTESAFARIFEGWVDKAPEEHEESFSVEHSHEEEDDEVEPSNSQDEEEDDEEDAHSAISEEQEVSKTESEEPEDDDDTIEQDEDEEEEEDTAEASTEKDETLETIEEESKASASVVSQDEPEEEEDHDFQEQITQRIEKSRETSSTSKEILQTLENIDEEEEIVQLDKVEPEIVQEVKIEKAEDGGEQTPDNVADEAEKESSSSERIKPVGTDSDSEDENWTSKRSGANSVYEFSNITNVDDMKIRKELDRAEQNLANGAAFALTLFNKILEKHPVSPRALYGKSKSLDALAEEKKSNKFLEEAITTYQKILKFNDVPDVLFQVVAERCINRMRFRGFYVQAVPIHKLLISRFPENVHFQNELAVTYLTMNNFYDAKKVLYDILSKWPDNGFAMVNYGFILKLYDLDLKEAVKFLKKGLETKDPGVIDGRFYYHLGDALIRLGRKDEAMEVHIDGVKNNVFLSKYQRSLHNVNGLLGKPWWKTEDIPDKQFFDKLEQNWKIIRDEGLKLLDTGGLFKMESEDLREVGDWKQFELYARGIKNVKNCRQCPKTCQIIESFPDAIGCKRGQIKFSVVQPGTHVWPHCGPTNCRLRSHLGLKVPSNVFIRVADEIRSWKDGQILIFDDSFEHEIWHNGSSTRLILIVDFWHPQLSKQEKRSLSSV